jgi:hypothetical protein
MESPTTVAALAPARLDRLSYGPRKSRFGSPPRRNLLARRAGQERGTRQSALARRRIDVVEQAGVESQIGADRASFVDQHGNENGGLARRDVDLARGEDFTRLARFRASHPLSFLMNDPFPRGGSRVADRRLGAVARAVAARQIGNADAPRALTFIDDANVIGHCRILSLWVP